MTENRHHSDGWIKYETKNKKKRKKIKKETNEKAIMVKQPK